MPAAQRNGDSNAGGGVAQGGVPSVRVNGLAVMIPAQPVTPHPPYGRRGSRTIHNNGSQVTAGGVGSVRAAGQPIVVTGDADTCGHPRQGGSPDVRVG